MCTRYLCKGYLCTGYIFTGCMCRGYMCTEYSTDSQRQQTELVFHCPVQTLGKLTKPRAGFIVLIIDTITLM